MDIPLQSKVKRGPKKMLHCLNKPKQSNQREDQPARKQALKAI